MQWRQRGSNLKALGLQFREKGEETCLLLRDQTGARGRIGCDAPSASNTTPPRTEDAYVYHSAHHHAPLLSSTSAPSPSAARWTNQKPIHNSQSAIRNSPVLADCALDGAGAPALFLLPRDRPLVQGQAAASACRHDSCNPPVTAAVGRGGRWEHNAGRQPRPRSGRRLHSVVGG